MSACMRLNSSHSVQLSGSTADPSSSRLQQRCPRSGGVQALRSHPRQRLTCQASSSSSFDDPDSSKKQALDTLQDCRPFRAQLSAVFSGSIALAAAELGGGDGGNGHWQTGGDGGGSGGGLNQILEVARADEGDDEEGSEDEEGEEGSGSEYEDSEDEAEAEIKAEEDLAADEFFVDEIVIEGLPEGEGVPTKEELMATMQCQPGFVCNRSDLTADLRNFMNWGIFQDVQARVSDVSKDGKSRVIFTFIEFEFPPPKSCDIQPYKGSKLALPASVVERVRDLATGDGDNLNAKKMFQIRKPIEDWYQGQGYTNSYVTHIDGMETGKLKVRVMEGKVNNVNIVPVDADGNPTGKPGNIPMHIIMREVPFKRGQIFNADFLRKCLKDVFSLGLFESMSVNSRPSSKDDTRVDIDLMVKERPVKTADVDLEWQIAPTASGRPGLATWVPGGSLTWENGNLFGTGKQLSATATTANFLNPSDDLGYQLSFKHPDLRGEYDPKRTELNAAVFNTRKLSPVFAPDTSGPGKEDVPALFVDRLGAKVQVSEQYARNSKGAYGLVIEQVTTLEDTGGLAPRGTKPLLMTGEYDPNGPPTSISGTGKDTVAFLQGGLTRDTTYYQSGMQLGDRQALQVEQGLGIGSKHPIFNRHRLSWTRFQPLEPISKDSRKAPKVLVLHGCYGGCVGDILPYDLFTLGGPYSVRGYNVGELASTRYFLEGAAELRVPVMGRTVYGFLETASDLGSSKTVPGNPTLYYKRPGRGTSLGLGVKLGAARLECASEGFARPGVLNVRFGERF